VLYRLSFEGGNLRSIQLLDHITRKFKEEVSKVFIFPAKHYVLSEAGKQSAISAIRSELAEQLKEFEKAGKVLEADRLSRRTRYDLEMIEEVGYCNGIENYSRHFDGRNEGDPPSTLLDYFPKDFLLMIDESHVTLPQLNAMYAGDKSRKDMLVEHGFRLPSARDNRPLRFEEFQKKINQTIFTSATPSDFERLKSTKVVEQIIRPTGLVDPEVEIRPITAEVGKHGSQVEDLMNEIQIRVEKKERTLVTTLTKKMAEDLNEYLTEKKIKTQYLHSDVETLDRITILTDFRKGQYDVLIGVNLLREGLDLPEVTLVAILDADKEGFLRSETSLIQTIGRAARNVDGKVILYADEMTGSLTRVLKETNRRRKIQIAYNKKNNITPKTIQKKIGDIRAMFGEAEADTKDILKLELTAEPHEIKEVIREKEKEMRDAAFNLDFETAAILRDQIVLLKKEIRGFGGGKRRKGN